MTTATNTPRILSIQSHVACGHVGNAAATFPLQRAGLDVISVPTVIFSNHPGHAHFAGHKLSSENLADILDGLAESAWFGPVDAVISGYLGNAGHAAIIADHITRLKHANPNLIYCCDPVCGDGQTGLYVSPDIAQEIHSRLFPLADYITPNWFEFTHYLGTHDLTINDVPAAARTLKPKNVLCTSVPFSETEVGEILTTPRSTAQAKSRRRARVPHGSGDLFSALFVASLLKNNPPAGALTQTHTIVQHILERSATAAELQLIENQQMFEGL